jgi:hypothetical protein
MMFAEFVERWKQAVLPQHKRSSQSSEKVHLTRLLKSHMDSAVSACEVVSEVDRSG